MMFDVIKHRIMYFILTIIRLKGSSELLEKHILLQKEFIKACKGDVNAQYNVGIQWMVWDHRNISKSYSGKEVKRAIKWFQRASEQGHPKARYELGEIYLHGKGKMISDERTAYEWMKKSAYQKDVDAEYKLGYMYKQGWGTQQDQTEARRWFEKAANSGKFEAQGELATMYEKGIGGEQNDQRAEYWKEQYKIGYEKRELSRSKYGLYPGINDLGIV